MDALFYSFTGVAIAEIGDKTQLLSLFLAARFRSRGAIIAGILVATLLNHAASAWFGAWVRAAKTCSDSVWVGEVLDPT